MIKKQHACYLVYSIQCDPENWEVLAATKNVKVESVIGSYRGKWVTPVGGGVSENCCFIVEK
jgi:hypothetical protein